MNQSERGQSKIRRAPHHPIQPSDVATAAEGRVRPGRCALSMTLDITSRRHGYRRPVVDPPLSPTR